MSRKIGLEVANGYIKVVSDDIEKYYPNRLKMLTGEEFEKALHAYKRMNVDPTSHHRQKSTQSGF